MPKATPKLVQAWLYLISKMPQLWTGSRISGYSESGPFHCGDCKYAKGRKVGLPWRDVQGKGRCDHPIVMIDPVVKSDAEGRKIIDLEKSCCEFVDDNGIAETIENPLLQGRH